MAIISSLKAKERDMKAFWVGLALVLFGCSALAQSSLRIDKLERKNIEEAGTTVGYSGLIEGTTDNPDQIIYALVHEPHLKAWRLFPATIHEEGGAYRWSALCHFGKSDGTGIGASYQVRVMALDRSRALSEGLPAKLSSTTLKSNVIVLKRTR